MDLELHCVHRLPLPYDSMEGTLYSSDHSIESNALSVTAYSWYLQSKLAMSDSAALSDAAAKARLKLGLFSYPVLQAADILVYRQVPDLEFHPNSY